MGTPDQDWFFDDLSWTSNSLLDDSPFDDGTPLDNVASEDLFDQTPSDFANLANVVALDEEFEFGVVEAITVETQHGQDLADAQACPDELKNIRDARHLPQRIKYQQHSPKASRSQQDRLDWVPSDNPGYEFVRLKGKQRKYVDGAQELSPSAAKSDPILLSGLNTSSSMKRHRPEENDFQDGTPPRVKRPRVLAPFSVQQAKGSTPAIKPAMSTSRQDANKEPLSAPSKEKGADCVESADAARFGVNTAGAPLRTSFGGKVRNVVVNALGWAGWRFGQR